MTKLLLSESRAGWLSLTGVSLHAGFAGSGEHIALLLLVLRDTGQRGNRDSFDGFGGASGGCGGFR